ncbi:PepSY-associated TM helix domain-containing protein [Mucilaginibacter sp. CAU 1740]|uniref:PepSY-associated TM helix domain-containing protein n=1 Tax=Mucilaginibacter sp. CAU 1740 TaxID=3140365 RepID=UPI00325BA9B2
MRSKNVQKTSITITSLARLYGRAGAVLSLAPASIFVFEKELTDWYYHDLVYINHPFATGKEKQPVSAIRVIAQRSLGTKKPVNEILISKDDRRAYVCSAYQVNAVFKLTFFSEYAYWDQLYIDPYNGKVLGKIDMRYDWIHLLRVIHQQLLLNYKAGHWLIAVASLIIFISIITGVVLWFRKKKAAFKQRFTIKWRARWRRVNYDIHNLGGFYTHLLIFLLAATGLVWSFDWWANGIYRLLGDDPKTVFTHQQKVQAGNRHLNGDPLDAVCHDALTKRLNWTLLYIAMPGSGEEPDTDQFSVFLNFNDHGGWDESDNYGYNKHTGILVSQNLMEHKTIGEKWRNSNYAIHTGSIYGLPNKILASVTTMFCALLPITGYLIWWGRRRKNNSTRKHS